MAHSHASAHQRSDAARRVRAIRGSAGSLIVTIFAAASHAAAGGDITGLALVATAILGLPLCVALAGKVASLWRLSVAVIAAQFVYHWSFAGLGVSSHSMSAASAAAPLPAHAHHAHHAAMLNLLPTDSLAAADALMWVSHAFAALLTVALLHRGERAALALLQVMHRAVTRGFARITLAPPQPPAHGLLSSVIPFLTERLFAGRTLTYRGPPLFAPLHP